MMLKDPSTKYRPFVAVDLPDRQWPSQRIETPPQWCSVDLRDGNQALIDPMDQERKQRFFDLLVKIGFKQIEVGFPSASQTDFDFVRSLIEEDKVPDDVTIQVLTQARPHLIERTFESLKGAKNAIVHVYNATDPVFRRVVFNVDKSQCIQIAVDATTQIRDLMKAAPETNWTFQYSPELFTTTEMDFAVEIVNAVRETFGASADNKMIVNLPATVECATPNNYADQIEWFCRNVEHRDHLIVSVHPHNDRGTGVAAAELTVMAGADRVEGTLFGNGERTGNVDIVTLAMNLYTQGVHPGLDFSNITPIMREVEHCNQLPVHPRHPYVGDLVFTAFSGSHQDAIKKGMALRKEDPDSVWAVPYLPIDPLDVGRSYEAVIRVNSQSGKGGVSYLLEQEHGIELPRRLSMEFSLVVQEVADRVGKEITSAMIYQTFVDEYLAKTEPYSLVSHRLSSEPDSPTVTLEACIAKDGERHTISGEGNGPLAAFVKALRSEGHDIEIIDYHEHSRGQGADAEAIAYVEVRVKGEAVFGVGTDESITSASIKGVMSAINRCLSTEEVAPNVTADSVA
ncbi:MULTISPECIES: 2-isopropylmalate synthase [unclassified Halomonas]|mgnify:CR=1 FL=1|uniref:2-isopropylmalate synthase n=1 Tax=Halomonas sp. H10-59 TaxID=2950874 RepID=A0AAU7KWW9_9GAMM|nr:MULTISPECIES: 2-isopropylmalate synthase [unclassified Halomonas]MBR9881409.1 2-isopropylmalate synthase [Gammaproteobacteria bacterium]KJZ06615.1 2-isopropylmalate synthase [Halomonas sp. S2151]MAR71674.1 2-isopropylmalate synthase [Halomonas sp.]MBY6109196.1 2-isopropylmalate synthase [Halomonas sp. DP1Y21-3]MCO7215358.1 2-isopropylmalate synthase [Halomonas sp. OfavH-34-E]|tara:strand:- start:1267 stop:2973 length:1707 start_codon:yes stop_codon:yes gene_type:complete